MTCASVELLEAMRGVFIPGGQTEPDAFETAGCSGEVMTSEEIVWGWSFNFHERVPPHTIAVDCFDCLALMREARGGVRDDALQERESAAKSVLVNAEFDAERAAKSEAA